MSTKTGKQLYESWVHQQPKRTTFPRWDDLPWSTQHHWNKKAIHGVPVTPPAMNAASEGDKLHAALLSAEAALSDIGDADREPGADLAWAERRAAEVLPKVRGALVAWSRRAALAAKAEQSNSAGSAPYRVAEFWSSSRPGTKVRMLAEGDDIEQWGKRGDFIRWVDAPVAERAAAPASDSINEMRIALTVQLNSLIDLGDRYARRIRDLDPDESAYAQGAIDHARKVASPYSYNGPYRAAPEVAQPAAQGEAKPNWKRHRMASVPFDHEPGMRLVGFVIPNEGADMPSVQLAKILATPAPTAGEPSACPVCPRETPYGPAICAKCVEAQSGDIQQQIGEHDEQ